MKIHPRHMKRICRSILALDQLADHTADQPQAELLRDAAFYLTELSLKHACPEAESLIEMR